MAGFYGPRRSVDHQGGYSTRAPVTSPRFCTRTDLLRCLHSASSLLHQGVPRNQAQREAGIFDRKGDRRTATGIMAAAKKMPPAEAASRLRDAVRTQAESEKGIGDPRHALEGLTVVLADRLRELAPG